MVQERGGSECVEAEGWRIHGRRVYIDRLHVSEEDGTRYVSYRWKVTGGWAVSLRPLGGMCNGF